MYLNTLELAQPHVSDGLVGCYKNDALHRLFLNHISFVFAQYSSTNEKRDSRGVYIVGR